MNAFNDLQNEMISAEKKHGTMEAWRHAQKRLYRRPQNATIAFGPLEVIIAACATYVT